MRTALGTIGLFAVLAIGTGAHAQSGLPHRYTVPGAVNSDNGIGTYVSCTNGSDVAVTVTVEAYDATGAFMPGAVAPFNLPPFATIVFGTKTSVSSMQDFNMALPAFKGHLRIVGGGSKTLCSAFVADASSPQPAVMRSLPVLKKFKP